MTARSPHQYVICSWKLTAGSANVKKKIGNHADGDRQPRGQHGRFRAAFHDSLFRGKFGMIQWGCLGRLDGRGSAGGATGWIWSAPVVSDRVQGAY